MPDRFIRGEHVLCARVGEGMLVVHTRTLTYVELDAVAADPWELFADGATLAQAVTRLAALYEADPGRLADDLAGMVGQWVRL